MLHIFHEILGTKRFNKDKCCVRIPLQSRLERHEVFPVISAKFLIKPTLQYAWNSCFCQFNTSASASNKNMTTICATLSFISSCLLFAILRPMLHSSNKFYLWRLISNPVDTGRKLNVNCTFNFHPVSTGKKYLRLGANVFQLSIVCKFSHDF